MGSNMERATLTAAVSPTPELPFPVVYTPRGATDEMYLSSWDFATPGSPEDTVEQRMHLQEKRHEPEGRERLTTPQGSTATESAAYAPMHPKMTGARTKASPLHNVNHDTRVLGRQQE